MPFTDRDGNVLNLTSGFTIVDYQATPSGYFQIAFRSTVTGHRITATSTSGLAATLYSPRDWEDEFFIWVGENAAIAAEHFIMLEQPELASIVEDRGIEWEDLVVLAIANLVEMKVLGVQG